jgi:glycosyltransferase involved in cell wall biosynthesis
MIKTESRLVDGIFCISHYLLNFYRTRDFPLHKLMLVPSTVDPERFSESVENPLPFTYVGYFGTMTFERDNIDVLVRAFANVACKHPALHLVLGGLATDSEKEKIKLLAAKLGINGRLKILDYMPREEIIRYIMNSRILVMVRADDVKLQASFPSKLAEYLSTGKPVVTVNVGEISRFLTDGVNAFIVEPGDSNKLADKIDLVLSGYDSALIVAQNGKQLTETVFNYNYQAKRIIPFIESLYKV